MALPNTAPTETSESSDDVTAAVKLEDLTTLLEPVVEKPEGTKEGEADGDIKKAKPEMFNDLAEALGIELDDLYKLQVSTTDGKTVTIEEMKALQTTQDDI